MGGALKISNELSWVPARWVFDNALEMIAKQIESQHSELAAELLAARTSVGIGYLNLQKYNREVPVILLRALGDVQRDLEKAGDTSFALPEYYPAFMMHLRELAKLFEDSISRKN